MAKKENKPGETLQQTAGAAPAEQTEPVTQTPDTSAAAATDNGAETIGITGQPAAGAPPDEGSTADASKTPDKPKKPATPSVSDAVVKIGKSLLKAYPELSVVYMTSDGRGFYQKDDAEGHARTLKNQAVTPVEKQ